MAPLLIQLAAIATSLVLVLPPGWCAVWAQHDVLQRQTIKKTCCHSAGENRPCEAPGTPADPPSGKCCCSWDATVPNEPVKVADAASSPLLIVAEAAIKPLGQVSGIADNPLDLSGPRLHVLHCVWRC
jgi:hypothetical protein